MTVYVLRYGFYSHLLGVYSSEQDAVLAWQDFNLSGYEDENDYTIVKMVVDAPAELT